jgi:hypothetical protein
VLRRSEVGRTYLTNDGLVLGVRGEIRCLMGTHRHGPTARAQSAAGRGGGVATSTTAASISREGCSR